MHRNYRSGNLSGRENAESLGVDGRIVTRMDLREIRWEGVGGIHLAHDRDR
jgi:hypothetical protein